MVRLFPSHHSLLKETLQQQCLIQQGRGLSQTVLANILELTVNKKYKGSITTDEIGLSVQDSNIILPCGIFARWDGASYED